MSDIDMESLAISRLVLGLKTKLSLTDSQCYPVAVPDYVEGQPSLVVQVAPGASSPEGGGAGGQWGGSLVESSTVTLAVWIRVNKDIYGSSEQALIETYNGLVAQVKRIRELLELTWLGTHPEDANAPFLLSPMEWAGNGTPLWYDKDEGVIRQDINHRLVWARERTQTETLTNTDVTE